MRRWARVLWCLSLALCVSFCSGGRGAPPSPPSPIGPTEPVDPGESPGCGMQTFPDPPLFSACPKPVVRQCPLSPGPEAVAVYSAGTCLARNGAPCTPQPLPLCFSDYLSTVVSLIPPAEGLCGPEIELNVTAGMADWTLREFSRVDGRCSLVSTERGRRAVLPCCRTIVELPLQQASGTNLRLSIDGDWVLR